MTWGQRALYEPAVARQDRWSLHTVGSRRPLMLLWVGVLACVFGPITASAQQEQPPASTNDAPDQPSTEASAQAPEQAAVPENPDEQTEDPPTRTRNERDELLLSQPAIDIRLHCPGGCASVSLHERRLSFDSWALESRWPMRITGLTGVALLLAGGIASIATGNDRERPVASYLLAAGASTLAATGSAAGWRRGGADRGYLIFGGVASLISLSAGTVLVAHQRVNWRTAGAGLLTGGVLQAIWLAGAIAHYRFVKTHFELHFAPSAQGLQLGGRLRF